MLKVLTLPDASSRASVASSTLSGDSAAESIVLLSTLMTSLVAYGGNGKGVEWVEFGVCAGASSCAAP